MSTKSFAVEYDDTQLTKDLKGEVMGDMQRRYSDNKIIELLDVTYFLDPRFKTQYIVAADLEIVKDELKDEGVTLVDGSWQSSPLAVEQEAKKREVLAPY